jgi:hypothetical protein
LLLSFLQGDGSNQRKKRGRGTVKGLAVSTKRVKERTQKLSIEFGSRGGPIGPNTRAFVDEVVLSTRKWAPLIGVSSWKDVNEDVKEEIAEEILVRCVVFFPTRVMCKINYDKRFDCLLNWKQLTWNFINIATEDEKRRKYGTLPRNGTKDGECNRTDQIIRAQVQKQAPKCSNFRT